MKHLTLLLAAALLMFSLTACGCSAKDSGSNDSAVVGGETAGTTNDSTSPNTGTSNGETGAGTGNSSGSAAGGETSGGSTNGTQNGTENGTSLVDDAQNAVNEGINDVQDALDGSSNAAKNSSAGGVSFRQMMRNARVHDTDGDLTDGENSRSDGKLF